MKGIQAKGGGGLGLPVRTSAGSVHVHVHDRTRARNRHAYLLWSFLDDDLDGGQGLKTGGRLCIGLQRLFHVKCTMVILVVHVHSEAVLFTKSSIKSVEKRRENKKERG